MTKLKRKIKLKISFTILMLKSFIPKAWLKPRTNRLIKLTNEHIKRLND